MAARSELAHRLREFKLALMGRLAPKVLSRKTDGLDGLAKKLAAKATPAAPDQAPDPDLLHPDDVPEIVTGRGAPATDPAGAVGRE